MSITLGSVAALGWEVRNSSDALVNATTAALTITLPDGTTSTPAVTNPPAVTGTYAVDYTTAVAGLHTWVAVMTTPIARVEGVFYVTPASAGPLVSLEEARAHLGLSATTADAQLVEFCRVASDAAETYTGLIWRRTTIVATFDGGTDLIRLRPPVISVSTITEDGSLLAATAYVVDTARGWLWRSTGFWSRVARQNVVVTYVAGPAGGLIPDGVRQGVLEMVRHLWETQRGSSGLPRRGPDSEWNPATTYSVPRRVQELWDQHRMPLVA